MTTFEQIENLAKTKKEGIFNIPYSSPQEKERLFEIGDRTKCTQNKICKIQMKDNYVGLEIINAEGFFKDIFDRVEEYIKDKDRENFTFDKVELTKYPEILNYYTIVMINLRNRINNLISKGWKITFQGTEDGFVLTKKFIAIFSARIINKGNVPYAVITPLTKGTSICLPGMRGFKFEDNKVITQLKNLYNFKEANGIDSENVLIEPDSIDTCYRYDETYFVNPTPNQVEKWWNYDCPDLYRVMINKDDSVSFFGFYMNCFENKLVEAAWNATYIGDDITEEEIEKFAGNYKHTAIYSQMQKALKARKTTAEEKQKEIKEVEDFEEKLQKIIDENKIRILSETVRQAHPFAKDKTKELENLTGNGQIDKALDLNASIRAKSSDASREKITDNDSLEETLKKCLYKDEQFTGYDCGFLNLIPTGSMLEKAKQIAEYDSTRYKTGALKIHIPWDGQSITIKKYEAQAISKVAKENGIDISYYTVLD